MLTSVRVTFFPRINVTTAASTNTTIAGTAMPKESPLAIWVMKAPPAIPIKPRPANAAIGGNKRPMAPTTSAMPTRVMNHGGKPKALNAETICSAPEILENPAIAKTAAVMMVRIRTAMVRPRLGGVL